MTCSTGIKIRKATANTIYASLDLHERVVHAVLKDKDGNILKESRMEKDSDNILQFLSGIDATIVIESGYNHQYIYDLLKHEGYDVRVVHPFMFKAIAYAKS